MPTLTWKPDIPTLPGVYFMALLGNPTQPALVELTAHEQGGWHLQSLRMNCADIHGWLHAVEDSAGTLWLGPIEPPLIPLALLPEGTATFVAPARLVVH